jgi:hypothetical protein
MHAQDPKDARLLRLFDLTVLWAGWSFTAWLC